MGIGGTLDEGGSSDAVESSSTFSADNRVVRTDGTGRNVQDSGITVDDSDNMTGVNSLTLATDLAVAHGGTGASTASGARTNLSAVAQASSSTDNALARFDGTGGDALQNSTVIVSDNGEMTNSSQPAFLAQLSATQSNVTGDGTSVDPIPFSNVIFDQNSDYDGTTNFDFTAPVSGVYSFNVAVLLGDLTSSHTSAEIRLNSSNRNYVNNYNTANTRTSGNQASMTMSVLADMDAGDTISALTTVNGGTKVVDVVLGGPTDPRSWFSGKLEA